MAEGLNMFGFWDYVVLVVILLMFIGIGLYYRFTGGKQKTVKEYLLADGNMPIIPVAFSLMASFMSAIALMGVASENYSFGIQFIVINIAHLIFTPVAAYLYLPVFFRLQATSAYEYLEKRFGKVSRLIASISYTFQMVIYMSIALYAPALTLEALTGVSQVGAILSVGLVCTFYSTIGGMKAVLMTDLFQSLLMFAAVFSIIICAIIQTGSFAEIFRIAERGNRTELFNFNPDPTVRHSWFSLIIGGGVTFLASYAVNQTHVQRYLTVKDLKQAQKALWLNWPILTCLSVGVSISGLAIYSRYFKCDPVEAGIISNIDQLMPYYVIDSMGHIPGLSGLFVSGIFSASLSTISAILNSLAAVTLEDYLKPMYVIIKRKPLSDKGLSLLIKMIAFSYGLLCVALAFLSQFLGGILQAAITIFGVVGGPQLGLFSLGMFTTTANQKGAVPAFVMGLSLSLWIAFGGPKPPLPRLPVGTDCNVANFTSLHITEARLPETYDESEYLWLYRISYIYNGVVGFLCTFVVGYLLSFAMLKLNLESPKVMDSRLYIPIIGKRVEKQNAILKKSDEELKLKFIDHHAPSNQHNKCCEF